MSQRMSCQRCSDKGAGKQNKFYLDVDISVPEVRMECVACHSSIQLSAELINGLIAAEENKNGGVSDKPTTKE